MINNDSINVGQVYYHSGFDKLGSTSDIIINNVNETMDDFIYSFNEQDNGFKIDYLYVPEYIEFYNGVNAPNNPSVYSIIQITNTRTHNLLYYAVNSFHKNTFGYINQSHTHTKIYIADNAFGRYDPANFKKMNYNMFAVNA